MGLIRKILGAFSEPFDVEAPVLGVESAIPEADVPPSADRIEAALRTLRRAGFTYTEGERYFRAPLMPSRELQSLVELIGCKALKQQRDSTTNSMEWQRLNKLYQARKEMAWEEAHNVVRDLIRGCPEDV